MNSIFDHAHLPHIKVRGNHLDHKWSNYKSTPYPTSPTESLNELVLKAAENCAIAKSLDPDQPEKMQLIRIRGLAPSSLILIYKIT